MKTWIIKFIIALTLSSIAVGFTNFNYDPIILAFLCAIWANQDV